MHGGQPGQAVASSAAPVAHLGAVDCRWNGPEIGLAPCAELAAGQELALAAGEAEIAFGSGARVLVARPEHSQNRIGQRARLLVGRVSARAETARSHGFTLHTQTISVLDLGTEFQVQAAADGHSEIHVTAGTVEIQTVKHPAKHRLQVGDTAQVEPGDAGVFAVIESGSGTPAFKFPTIAPPFVQGLCRRLATPCHDPHCRRHLHGESGPVQRLVDGVGQSTADSPGESVFFANNQKGKILLDLGKTVRVEQINTYSWHAYQKVPAKHDRYDTRATQRYNLYGYVGANPAAIGGRPGRPRLDPDQSRQHRRILLRPAGAEPPVQQAVSITAADRNVGHYRFLLWDVQPTHVSPDPPYPEGEQNTFFGEFDVFAEEGP